MNLTKDIDRALVAQQLLDNEIFKESLDNIRKAIFSQWESSPIRDVEGQHELKLMLKLLNDLEANIKRVMTDGKIAQIEVERQKKSLFGLKRA